MTVTPTALAYIRDIQHSFFVIANTSFFFCGTASESELDTIATQPTPSWTERFSSFFSAAAGDKKKNHQ